MEEPKGKLTFEFTVEIDKLGVIEIRCLVKKDCIPSINIISTIKMEGGLEWFLIIRVFAPFFLAEDQTNIKGMEKDIIRIFLIPNWLDFNGQSFKENVSVKFD